MILEDFNRTSFDQRDAAARELFLTTKPQSTFSFQDLGGHIWHGVGTGSPVAAICGKPCKACGLS